MRYLIVFLFLVLFIGGLTASSFEYTRQSIWITTNPLSTKMEEKTKLNWKITWGKIRPKEDED